MSKLKIVVVPVWLNLIQKELGIDNTDFACYEKLSGILSPRDLLIYKMLQFNMNDILNYIDLAKTSGLKLVDDFDVPCPVPTLEERASLANMSVETMAFGATHSVEAGEYPKFSVELADTELVIVRLYSGDKIPDNVKECNDHLARRLVKVLHGRVCLHDMVKTVAFKDYVNKIQNNPLFY